MLLAGICLISQHDTAGNVFSRLNPFDQIQKYVSPEILDIVKQFAIHHPLIFTKYFVNPGIEKLIFGGNTFAIPLKFIKKHPDYAMSYFIGPLFLLIITHKDFEDLIHAFEEMEDKIFEQRALNDLKTALAREQTPGMMEKRRLLLEMLIEELS